MRLLGRVHREVGALEQIGDLGAVDRPERDADARLRADRHPRDVDVGRERVQHAVEDRPGVLGVDTGQNEPEFVPAQASDRVTRPQDLGEVRRDAAQVVVPVVVAERVVDLLETVEVDDGDADGLAAPAGRGNRVAGPVDEQCPVRQIGQQVVQRHVLVLGVAPAKTPCDRPADRAQRDPQQDQPEHDQRGHRPVRRREGMRDRRVREIDLEHTDHFRRRGTCRLDRNVRLDRTRAHRAVRCPPRRR